MNHFCKKYIVKFSLIYDIFRNFANLILQEVVKLLK